MTISDSRLGTLNKDGSVQSHPETDVMGQPYVYPATTQGIGAGYFVVLPIGGGYEAAVGELKALVAPRPMKKVEIDDAGE